MICPVKWIRDQRPKRKRKPKPCSFCYRLTDDDYALDAPPGYPIICPSCKFERDILGGAEHLGWITADGRLTAKFRSARKRHYRPSAATQGGAA